MSKYLGMSRLAIQLPIYEPFMMHSSAAILKWESVISTFGPGIPAVTVVPPRRVMS